MKQIIIKTILFLFVATILTSCMTLQPIPLKGNYLDAPYELETDKSFDEVWSNIIDLFATKGLSIKLIDKSSGLIVSEKTSFLNNYTFEDKSGNLENEEAYIVIEKVTYQGYNQSVQPDDLTGEWNVRIKKTENDKTLINVNLTNITGSKFIAGSDYSPAQNVNFKGKSTGKFEELITELVK